MRRVNGLVVTASLVLAAAASPHAHAAGFDVQGCIERAEGAYSYTLRHRCAGLSEHAAEICRRAAQALLELDKAVCHVQTAPGRAMEASKNAMKAVGSWWPF
jgi:hypothetical protein